jgi:hypothetical protein
MTYKMIGDKKKIIEVWKIIQILKLRGVVIWKIERK